MDCPPVHGDNPRALASGLSYVQVDKYGITILTSTKNASLIITDFLAMIKENEQRRTASLCRGWAMLENDFNLICR